MNGRLFCQTSGVLTLTPTLNAVGSVVVTVVSETAFPVTGAFVVVLLEVPLAEPQAASKQKSGAAESAFIDPIRVPSCVDDQLVPLV
jgi:hypothetical protein